MKFVIERFVPGTAPGEPIYGWVRVPGATAASLREAEKMKLAIAGAEREDVKNFSILVEVDEDVKQRGAILI